MLSDSEIRTIHSILRRLPKLLKELDIQTTRRSQFGSMYADGGKNAGEKPLYFDESGTNARNRITEVLLKYRARVIYDWPVPKKVDNRDLDARMFLRLNVWNLRPYDEAFTDFDDARQEIVRVIDIPRARIYLGDCKDCAAKLYGDPEGDVIVCPVCAREDEPKVLRAANQKRGESMMVTAKQARDHIGEVLGIPLTQSRFNHWTQRGYLQMVTVDPGTRQKIYRLGDVVECVRQRAKESGDRSVRT